MPRPRPLRAVTRGYDDPTDALPDDTGEHGEQVDGPYRLVPIHRLHGHDGNPRRELTDVDELADSIAEAGLIEPLVATADPLDDDPDADQHYTLVAGHRRLAALHVLDGRLAGHDAGDGGLDLDQLDRVRELVVRVPVLVRDDLADDRVVAALIENTQRVDLSPLEEATALAALVEGGMTQADVARRIGRNQGHVSKRLTLHRDLHPALRPLLVRRAVTIEQAVTLARLDADLQREAAAAIASGSAAEGAVAYAVAVGEERSRARKPAKAKAAASPFEVNPDALPDAPATPDPEDLDHPGGRRSVRITVGGDPAPAEDPVADAGWTPAETGAVPDEPPAPPALPDDDVQPLPDGHDVVRGDAGSWQAYAGDGRRWATQATPGGVLAALLAVLDVPPLPTGTPGAAYYARALQTVHHHAHQALLADLRADVPAPLDGQAAIDDELPEPDVEDLPADAPADEVLPAPAEMPLPVPLKARAPRADADDVTAATDADDEGMTAWAALGVDADTVDAWRAAGVLDDAATAWYDLAGGQGADMARAADLKPGIKAAQLRCPGCDRYARVARGPKWGRHMMPGGLHACPSSYDEL